ncbi:MAG: S-layer homology domain-containing protein [Clostridia bacterium]|nr:S-layer homology domain-containing protein [Clostridia bacterium]
MKRSLTAFVLIFALLLGLGSFAYADNDGTMPTSAKLYVEDVAYPMTKDASGEGWSYDTETVTLTLNGYKGGDIHLYSYYTKGLNLNVELVGENDVTRFYSTCYEFDYDSDGNRVIGGGGFLFDGSGSLICDKVSAPMVEVSHATVQFGRDQESYGVGLETQYLTVDFGAKLIIVANSYNGSFYSAYTTVDNATIEMRNAQCSLINPDYIPSINNGSIIYSSTTYDALEMLPSVYAAMTAGGNKFSTADGSDAGHYTYFGDPVTDDDWGRGYVRSVSAPKDCCGYIVLSKGGTVTPEPEKPDVPDTPDTPDVPDTPEESEKPSVSFSDVAPGAWYEETIIAAAEAVIIAGNADGSYNPNGKLTWAQTLVFAVRLHPFNSGKHIYGSEDQGTPWYKIYVDYALECGFICAQPENMGDPITRADAAVLFAQVLGSRDKVNEVPNDYFSDVLVKDVDSAEAEMRYAAIYTLARCGIVNGMTDGSFGVNNTLKRSEVATIVARMAGLADPALIK